uniref:ZF-HD dimerization-type domain-containing protein n=1 Tax=Setaria viridis TaxID=4556 RepID=A0A4U6TUV4_SETVI|nr:LOW QUALITY PROTEIN: hypothetical protein SEVIR_8G184400v2 [Setaria viridis]
MVAGNNEHYPMDDITVRTPYVTHDGGGGVRREAGVYRECLKNHAASLGGHALDGCGEFMPSSKADPADPALLRCAACGCHRNFHHRLPEAPPSPPLLALPPPLPTQPASVPQHVMHEAPEDRLPATFDDDETDESGEGSDFDEDRLLSPLSPLAMGLPGYLQPVPHMLLVLSTGAPGASIPTVVPRPPASLGPMPAPGAASTVARKRFRTKFSPEQKQGMQALSERPGCHLQMCLKQEDGNNLCGYHCCEFIHIIIGPKKITAQEYKIFEMRDKLITTEQLKAIWEQLCGFLLEEVVNPKEEFYYDGTSVGQLHPIRDSDDDA